RAASAEPALLPKVADLSGDQRGTLRRGGSLATIRLDAVRPRPTDRRQSPQRNRGNRPAIAGPFAGGRGPARRSRSVRLLQAPPCLPLSDCKQDETFFPRLPSSQIASLPPCPGRTPRLTCSPARRGRAPRA